MSLQRQNFLYGDLRRALLSIRFPVGVLGVAFALFYSLYRMSNILSVYAAYIDALYFIPFAFALLFCAFPFSESLIEDIEHKYIQLLVMRGSLKKYTLSKVILIYMSAIVVMILGTLLFTILAHLQAPWELKDEYLYTDIFTKIFWKNGFHLLFFASHSFFIGLLAGNLALLAAYVSLFWQEKLLVVAFPFLAYYLVIYYEYGIFGNIVWLDIRQIFNLSYDVWNNPVYSILWPIIVSLFIAVFMGIGIYRKLRRIYDT